MSRRLPSGSTSEVVFAKQRSKRGTIILRYQLAQDGCTESQFSLAKSLLGEIANDGDERRINAGIAVYWLLQAATKGHGEAFKLLKQCSDTGIGVNEENCFAVAKCLQLSENQVIARRVAHSIITAVMSDIEETIAEEVFQQRVEAILKEDQKETEANTSDSSENNFRSPPQKIFKETSENPASSANEPCVSLGDVVSSVQQCLEGSLPLVALKRVAQYEEYNKWFSLKYAHKISSMLRSALIMLVQDLGRSDIVLTLLLCSLFLFMFNSFFVGYAKNLISDRLFLCAIISLVTMQSCSCYIIHHYIGLHNINQWFDLIRLFEPTVKTKELKERYLSQTLFPFLLFFISSIVFNILYPFNAVTFISGELFVFCIVMLVLLDRTITLQRYHINVSLILNILLCLNKMSVLTNHNFGWLNFLNFEVFFPICGGYEIHLNWLSCFSLPFVLPYLYSKMACGNERKGWYLVLLPHLVCLTWLNLACAFFSVAETGCIFFNFFFWLAVLVFAKYVGAIPSLIFTSLTKGLYVAAVWPGVSVLAAIIFFTASFFTCSFLIRKMKSIFSTIAVALMLLVAFVFVMFIKEPVHTDQVSGVSEPVLAWDKYETYCHRHAWYRSNTANVEIACLPLRGKQIAVEGTVTGINVVAVTNHMGYFVSLLPNPISGWLTCALGENFCSGENLSLLEKEHCTLYDNLNINRCHLHNWDSYQYHILLEVSSRTSPEIIVKADHSCSTFIRTLKEGDLLHVVGRLSGAVGSSLPEILLHDTTCNTCFENIKCIASEMANNILFDSSLSIDHLVKFYLSPFIQLKN